MKDKCRNNNKHIKYGRKFLKIPFTTYILCVIIAITIKFTRQYGDFLIYYDIKSTKN